RFCLRTRLQAAARSQQDLPAGCTGRVTRGGMMRTLWGSLLATETCWALVLTVSTVQAQSDHLRCYKVRDPQPPTSYTADLGGLVADTGCTIRLPAKMACVPSTKTNVTPTPPGGGGTGTPNSFFCYRVKCPPNSHPALSGADQFGIRTVQTR